MDDACVISTKQDGGREMIVIFLWGSYQWYRSNKGTVWGTGGECIYWPGECNFCQGQEEELGTVASALVTNMQIMTTV